MTESEVRLKSLLMSVKEQWKRVLKLNIQKTKNMVSVSITSLQIEWEKVEAVTDFLFLVSKLTADLDCSHEIKRWLLLGRKTMTNLDSILKSRDITLPTKVHIAKAIVFPVVMYGCESWTIKKAESQRIDAFESCWRWLLGVPWIAKRLNQLIPNEINTDIGRTDADIPILWLSDMKSWLIGRDLDVGKDRRPKRRGGRGWES